MSRLSWNKPNGSGVPSPMAPTVTVSRARRLAASGSFLVVVGASAWLTVVEGRHSYMGWKDIALLLAMTSILASAALGLSRRSLFAQVYSRAIAWLTFVPMLAVTGVLAIERSFELLPAALTAASGLALLLARPMLHTTEARATFEPVRFRKWLLAGATSATAAGLTSGTIGFAALVDHHPMMGVGFGAFGTALLASALGVLRMRAWGVLLGIATSIVSVLGALVAHDASSLAWLLGAVPGMILGLPVLLARGGKKSEPAVDLAHVRVAANDHESGPRIRVAEDEVLALEDENPAPRAARASVG
jgi:hypothetical protein